MKIVILLAQQIQKHQVIYLIKIQVVLINNQIKAKSYQIFVVKIMKLKMINPNSKVKYTIYH